MKPWEIAVKLLPSANGTPVDVAHAADSDFQAWVESNGLAELVDDNGIVAWSFDDRVRIINFALGKGRELHWAGGKINSNNSPNSSERELFDSNDTASEAV